MTSPFCCRIVRGGADESYGIEVSKLAGIPDAVIVRAKEILQSLESTAPTHASQVRISDDSDDSEQVSFASMGQTRVVERLKQIDINTLSPIEALQTLYELTQMV